MSSYFGYLALVGLFTLTWTTDFGRKGYSKRSTEEWVLDGTSLLIHFVVIPLLQIGFVFPIFSILLPSFRNSLSVGWVEALGAILLIDYCWYWNHRLFHARTRFWSLHKVHHAPTRLGFQVSSRNSVWSPLCMVYFWLIPLVLYLAEDPAPFLYLAGLALFINFWGHTHLDIPDGRFRKFSAQFLIQPMDHHWHHSTEKPNCNFGTVFNFWDRIHGTWYAPGGLPKSLGFELDIPTWKKLLFPSEGKSSG